MRAAYVASFALLSLAVSEGCRGGDAPQCQQGAERCPCYPNGTCNTGLTCLSSVCVQAGGGGGGNQAGTTGTGGSASGGAGGGHGGTDGGVMGGTGGSSGGGTGGGAVIPDAGIDAQTCGDTQTDPKNCGQCGRVCKNANPVFEEDCPHGGCCQAGKCAPSLGSCLVQTDGFATCADYCRGIGETCVEKGCGNAAATFVAWGTISSAGCDAYRNIGYHSLKPCDMPIQWDPITAFVRCCCTDTHP
jgi:hypothetical protein